MSKMIPMTPTQRERCVFLYQQARGALEGLSEERLNLDSDVRDALNAARGALETFDYLRGLQPITQPEEACHA